jgi:hypothetical protein
MKQGRATTDHSAGTKVEPVPHAVDPKAVARLGVTQIYGTENRPLYEGRGLKAPMAGETSHKSGSQGKY